MAKWDAALYTEKLLKRSSLDQIWTAAKTASGGDAPFNYGFGWFIESYHGHHLVQHSGGTPGFSSAIFRFIDDKLTVILLTNHSDSLLDQVALDLAGKFVPALKKPDRIEDPDPKTTLKLREILSALLDGRTHDSTSLAPPVEIFLNTATGKAFWKWFGSFGSLESLTLADREEVENGRVLRYEVTLGGNRFPLTVKITRDGKITQLHW